jgi:hypothetical protein
MAMTKDTVQAKQADGDKAATRSAAASVVQCKLAIGAVNDPLEAEADTMADKVMRMPVPANNSKQAAGSGAGIQRKCDECEEEKIQRRPLASSITPYIQAKGGEGGTASTVVTNQINATKGSGSSMDTSTQSFMESRFGTDFSNVKIHTGNEAVQMSSELSAQAFTVGSDIYFNSGKYNPSSDSGKHLLAHELTHTVQQGGGNAMVQRRTWADNETQCTATQKIKVQLLFKDNGADTWTAARKTTFRNNFKSGIENTFNSNGYHIKPSTGSYVPWYQFSAVTCPCFPQGFSPRVEIDLVPEGEYNVSEDWEADVVANTAGTFVQSETNTSYGDLDEADNTAVTKEGAGTGVTQIPAVHEFGHFLGLDHPGKGLNEGMSIGGITITTRELSPGADEYSHVGNDNQGRSVDGTTDLMGAGMGLRSFYFDSWLNHIKSKYNMGCKYTVV